MSIFMTFQQFHSMEKLFSLEGVVKISECTNIKKQKCRFKIYQKEDLNAEMSGGGALSPITISSMLSE